MRAKLKLSTIHRASAIAALFLWTTLFPAPCPALPAQDVRVINNRDYFPSAIQLIQHSAKSIRVVMYLAQRYNDHPESPSNQLLEALVQASKRGVDVKVILEKGRENDSLSQDLARKNKSAAAFLTAGGVQVLEDSAGVVTHAKMMVVDGRTTIVGSTNWTYAALERNNETAVLIDSADIASEYLRLFEQIKAQ